MPPALKPMNEAEKARILKAIKDSGGNVLRACLALGISHSGYYRKIALIPEVAPKPYRKPTKQEVRDALTRCRGNQGNAAKILGIDRMTVSRFLRDNPDVPRIYRD